MRAESTMPTANPEINLAPTHKLGLCLAHPLLLAAGTVSYGETLPPGVELEQIGGVVVGPIMAQSRSGQHGPRLTHMPGGLVLDHGSQNRGASAAVRRFSRLWETLPCAVIIQIADTDIHALGETLDILNDASGYDGIELLLPDTAPIKTIRELIQTAASNTDRPLLVKLPLPRATRLASVALEAGASALVIGEPKQAILPVEATKSAQSALSNPAFVRGRWYGPANFAAMLNELSAVHTRHPNAVLVACGGIHSPQMAQQARALGAQAIALDSVVWIDPASVHAIAAAPLQ